MPAVSALPASTRPSGAGSTESSTCIVYSEPPLGISSTQGSSAVPEPVAIVCSHRS